MPDLQEYQDLLSELTSNARSRPDLITPGSTGALEIARPVTYMGRLVKPGETPQQVLNRLPMGEMESGGQAMQAIPQALLAGASKAMMVSGGRFYHGTSNVFDEFNPSLSKSSGLVGPGHAYLTNEPTVAADYARGATAGVKFKSEKELADYLKLGNTPHGEGVPSGFAPNIRPYAVKTHNAFVTDATLGQADMESLLQGARVFRDSLNKTSGTQKGNVANRAASVENVIKAGVGQPGQQTYEALSNMLGPDLTNRLIKESGFKSIQYPGGVIMGDTKHRALNVLDQSIMKNLFDALSGK